MSYRYSHLDKGGDYDKSLAADPFDAYLEKWEQFFLRKIIKKYFNNHIPRYLDFACGTGRVTLLFEQFCDFSMGVDISPTMLDKAKEKCWRTNFILTDGTQNLSATYEPFDVITCFRFFGNAEDPLRKAALSQIFALLKPGGVLILNNHRNPWAIRKLIGRLTCEKTTLDLTPIKLNSLLAENNFSILEMLGVGAWLVRERMLTKCWLNSGLSNFLDPTIGRLRGVAYLSPDYLIIARKENNHDN